MSSTYLSHIDGFSYVELNAEERRMIQRPKGCVTTNNNKDEDNSPKNNTKYCTSSLVSKIQTDVR